MKKSIRILSLALCVLLVLAAAMTAFAATNVKVKKRTLKKETDSYTYRVEYPRTGVADIDEEVYEYVQEEIEDFVDSAADCTPITFGEGEDPWLSEMTITFKLYRRDKNTVSFLFEKTIGYAGAAHPSTMYEAMNFDTRTGDDIDVEDLFKTGWEKKLAKLCYKPVLKAMCAEDDAITQQDVTEALKNSEVFDDAIVLTKSGILIAFDHYELAAYVMGAPVISLSNKTIKSILK